MINPRDEIVARINKSFEEKLMDKPADDNIYALKVELPEEVIVDGIVLDLIDLDYSLSVVDNALTVYKKHNR